MKKTNMLTMLLVGALVLTSASSFAASSGTITLQGSVGGQNVIAVTPQSGYNTLDLVNGESDKYVALVNEKNNDPDGYTVTLSSLNASGSQARLKGDGSANTTKTTNTIKNATRGGKPRGPWT